MYESFYGLKSKPFLLNPDPLFYFGSKQHRKASAYLEYGLNQNEGFVVVTGEVGAGKTTIVRGLLNKLDPAKMTSAQLVSTQMDATNTLRLVAGAFGVRTKGLEKSDVLLGLEAFLIDNLRLGKRCILIVDEAQNLSDRAVEELRMLSNYQFGTQALIQTFLVGQPEFRGIMQSAQMQQLRQRVIAACHLGPMEASEIKGYIEHRLGCAGYKGAVLFEPDAYQAVFAESGGIPRRINTLCDRLLLAGFLANSKSFSAAKVHEVGRELLVETSSTVQSTVFTSNPSLTGSECLDLGATKGLSVQAEVADQLLSELGGLKTGFNEERLQRLEQRIHRIEQSCLTTVSLLQQLVCAVRVGKSSETLVKETQNYTEAKDLRSESQQNANAVKEPAKMETLNASSRDIGAMNSSQRQFVSESIKTSGIGSDELRGQATTGVRTSLSNPKPQNDDSPRQAGNVREQDHIGLKGRF